jgi:hypothetical protein
VSDFEKLGYLILHQGDLVEHVQRLPVAGEGQADYQLVQESSKTRKDRIL